MCRYMKIVRSPNIKDMQPGVSASRRRPSAGIEQGSATFHLCHSILDIDSAGMLLRVPGEATLRTRQRSVSDVRN